MKVNKYLHFQVLQHPHHRRWIRTRTRTVTSLNLERNAPFEALIYLMQNLVAEACMKDFSQNDVTLRLSGNLARSATIRKSKKPRLTVSLRVSQSCTGVIYELVVPQIQYTSEPGEKHNN